MTLPIIAPVSQGAQLIETTLTTIIHELLFRVEVDQSVFWVGAAVPFETFDFTKAQVFFHPTVVQDGKVIAADSDYQEFKGGWSGTMQRYVAMEGEQLAGARLTTLLVPFTTMSALNTSSANMFSLDPIGTLNAIMAAIISVEHPEIQKRKAGYEKALRSVIDKMPDALGYAFYVNGKRNTVDTYGSPALFRALWSKLLTVAVLEAIAARNGATSNPKAADVLRWITAAKKVKLSHTRDVPPRARVLTRVSQAHVTFETYDRASGDVAIHINAVAR